MKLQSSDTEVEINLIVEVKLHFFFQLCGKHTFLLPPQPNILLCMMRFLSSGVQLMFLITP